MEQKTDQEYFYFLHFLLSAFSAWVYNPFHNKF